MWILERRNAVLAVCLMLLAVVGGCSQDLVAPAGRSQLIPTPPFSELTNSATVFPIADTYVGAPPDSAHGTESLLVVKDGRKNGVLVRFDMDAVRTAIGGGTLQTARIRLTIASAGANWGNAGRPLGLFRMLRPWSEMGATWNCANDANPQNAVLDCSSGDLWNLGGAQGGAWHNTSSAGTLIFRRQEGVIDLDVTDDVRAMLANSVANFGWILLKTDSPAGDVSFGSRESGAATPTLTVSFEPPPPPPPPPAPANGLVLFYPLDGSAIDASGSNLHGTATNPDWVADRRGTPGAALHIPSNNTWVLTPIPPSSPVSFTTRDQFSLSAWIRVDSLPRGPENAILFTAGLNEVSWGFQVQPNGTAYATVCTPTEYCHSTFESGGDSAPSAIQPGVWTHFSMTYDGTRQQLRFYLNGRWVGTSNFSLSLRTTDSVLYFGTFPYGRQYWFAGSLDEIRVYNRLLSTTELLVLAEQPVPPPPPPTGPAPVCNATNARFFDDFNSPTVGTAWTVESGGWSQSAGFLTGSWSIFDAQSDQANLLLAQDRYDAENYVATFTLAASHAEGKLVSYVSPGNKYNFNFGYAYDDYSATSGVLNVEYRVGGSTYANSFYQYPAPSLTALGVDTVSVWKIGSRYRMVVNGVVAADFVDAAFAGLGRLGIGAYKDMRYDWVAVCDLVP